MPRGAQEMKFRLPRYEIRGAKRCLEVKFRVARRCCPEVKFGVQICPGGEIRAVLEVKCEFE